MWNHLKSTLYTAYFKDLYEEFSIYLKGMMKEIYSNAKVTPERLSGEHNVSLASVGILHRTLRNKAGQEKSEKLKGGIAGLSKEMGRLRRRFRHGNCPEI